MNEAEEFEVSRPLRLRKQLYDAIVEAARQNNSTVSQFCYDTCVPAFIHFDQTFAIENVGVGQVVSASFEDTEGDIWVDLTLSDELAEKLAMQGSIQKVPKQIAEMCTRVCISALQRATGVTNTRVAEPPKDA